MHQEDNDLTLASFQYCLSLSCWTLVTSAFWGLRIIYCEVYQKLDWYIFRFWEFRGIWLAENDLVIVWIRRDFIIVIIKQLRLDSIKVGFFFFLRSEKGNVLRKFCLATKTGRSKPKIIRNNGPYVPWFLKKMFCHKNRFQPFFLIRFF